MKKIVQLPTEIINQIAAGEVIENPASVVKELVENALDAKAQEIIIEIEEYGLKKIIVKDDGEGIYKEDLLKAPLKHATSKIKNFSDLYSIKSFGFRGEALATIFAIAKTEIISRTKDSEFAYKINSENIQKVQKSGRNFGTTISVSELFYNVPARKKYLKSRSLELKEIVTIVLKIALINNKIKILLKHNNKIIINKPKFNDLKENVLYLLGRDMEEGIIELLNKEEFNKIFPKFKNKGIFIEGLISNPTLLSYKYKKYQFIYVNKRPVRSKLIYNAVKEGLEERLMVGREPFFLINIHIDPEIIDVNIHPRKLEIKFENEIQIYELVKMIIQKSLKINSSIKSIILQNKNPKKEEGLKQKRLTEKLQKNETNKSQDYLGFKRTDTSIFENTSKDANVTNSNTKNYYREDFHKSYFSEASQKRLEKYSKIISSQDETKEKSKIFHREKNSLLKDLNKYHIIGTLNKTYSIIETNSSFILMDFHAAEEKIRYEEFILNFNNKNKIKRQKLIKPKIIKLLFEEQQLFLKYHREIESLGFKVEEFGQNEILVREVPIDYNLKPIDPEKIKELLNQNEINQLQKEDLRELNRYFARKACRSSRKAGYDISNKEVKNIIEKLKYLKEPLTCPHGRPTLIKFTWSELEKLFKRVV